MIPLQSRLYNNATVADWLGTAKTAAELGVRLLEEIRDETSPDSTLALNDALGYLQQATSEIQTVTAHLAHVAAYGERP